MGTQSQDNSYEAANPYYRADNANPNVQQLEQNVTDRIDVLNDLLGSSPARNENENDRIEEVPIAVAQDIDENPDYYNLDDGLENKEKSGVP